MSRVINRYFQDEIFLKIILNTIYTFLLIILNYKEIHLITTLIVSALVLIANIIPLNFYFVLFDKLSYRYKVSQKLFILNEHQIPLIQKDNFVIINFLSNEMNSTFSNVINTKEYTSNNKERIEAIHKLIKKYSKTKSIIIYVDEISCTRSYSQQIKKLLLYPNKSEYFNENLATFI